MPNALEDVEASGPTRPPSGVRLRSVARGRLPWWVTGTTLGVLVVGPAWTGDALLNLDLVVFDRIDVSDGFWGLGPAPPRRAPAVEAVAVASRLVDGTALVSALVIACVATAFVGIERLSRPAPWPARLAAAALYACSPWLLTRIAVGHLGLVMAAGVLPWVLPTLLRPDDDLRRTFLASAALGLAGYYGGTLAFVVVLVGLVASKGRRGGAVAGLFVLSQLPWLVPGVVVGLTTPGVTGAAAFATRIDSVGDVARLALGGGFWQRGNQLVLDSVLTPIAALLVLAVGIAGAGSLPSRWGPRAGALAAVGAVLAAIGSIPLLGALFERASTQLPAAALREPQRALVLVLVWLAPAAARGLAVVHRRDPKAGNLAAVGLLTVAWVTVSPMMWGLGGRFAGVDVPESWDGVRERIGEQPGTTLALPWTLYFDLEIADDRRTHHPIPHLVAGDVLHSSALELAAEGDAALDPREPIVDRALAELDAGRSIGGALDELGIRWVVVVTDVDDARYAPLRNDEALDVVIDDETIVLYAVRGWTGAAIDTDGAPVRVDERLPPLVRLGDEARVWHAPYSPGWLRALEPAARSPVGTIEVPAGTGTMWYWPTLLVMAGYASTAITVVVALGPWRGATRSRGGDAVPRVADLPLDGHREHAC